MRWNLAILFALVFAVFIHAANQEMFHAHKENVLVSVLRGAIDLKENGKVNFGNTYELLPGLAFYNGFSLNTIVEGYKNDPLRHDFSDVRHLNLMVSGYKVRLWPGFYTGFMIKV